MPVIENTANRVQGYSIVRITETNRQNDMVLETYALVHEAGDHIDEFADYRDAVRALNKLLFPLPGLLETSAIKAD